MTPAELNATVSRLRAAKDDEARVEVKSAAGGMPETILDSLSALANLPGGGVLILGLSENDGFRPVGLTDARALKQGLGNRARLLTPPAVLEISDGQVDGMPVVVAEVRECPPDLKPCRVTASRQAYLRSHDGDYRMTTLEEQGLLRARTAPLADREPVPDTSVDDLDPDLVEAWRRGVSEVLPALAGFNGHDQLLQAGVVTPEGQLTRSGLLMLGAYPQRFFPQFVVRVVDVRREGIDGERGRNLTSVDGAIPRMLTGTMQWMRSNLGHRTVEEGDDQVREVWDYPLIALRELVANALVHRDLDHWSEGMTVDIRLEADKLTITSPGGLYGITVDRLGVERQSSPRNARLFMLGQAARDPEDDSLRVVEAIASGLRRVAGAMTSSGLPDPRYFDQGIRFTAILHRSTASYEQGSRATPVEAHRRPGPKSGTDLEKVYLALAALPQGETVAQLSASVGLTPQSTRRALTRLRDELGLVRLVGGRGRPESRWYAVADAPQSDIAPLVTDDYS